MYFSISINNHNFFFLYILSLIFIALSRHSYPNTFLFFIHFFIHFFPINYQTLFHFCVFDVLNNLNNLMLCIPKFFKKEKKKTTNFRKEKIQKKEKKKQDKKTRKLSQKTETKFVEF